MMERQHSYGNRRGGGGGGGGGGFGFRKLDAFGKVDKEFFTRTAGGGLVTILAIVSMIILLVSETRLFLQVNRVHELEVDTSTGEIIKIHINITFPKMPCSWLSLDAMDVSGEVHLEVDDHNIFKQRLNSQGVPLTEAEQHDIHETKKTKDEVEPVTGNESCGSCYGAETHRKQCCNTCDEVRKAYRLRGWAFKDTDGMVQCRHDSYLESIKEQVGEGCRVWGDLQVNKVAGNFHFAPGKSYEHFGIHIHDVAVFGDAHMDFSHVLHTISFGEPYPGQHNPLDDTKVVQEPRPDEVAKFGLYQYFLKVVPTTFTPLDTSSPDSTLLTNQYSVTETFKEFESAGVGKLPGLFFFYDLSPIKVHISEQKTSFVHFLTNVCAIVGGVFTLMGILDAFIYQGEKIILKKRDIGKLG